MTDTHKMFRLYHVQIFEILDFRQESCFKSKLFVCVLGIV